MRNKFVIPAIVGAGVGAAAVTVGNVRGLAKIPFFTPDEALLHWRFLYYAVALFWVAFSLYWEISARNVKATAQSESKLSRAVHVALTNAALIFILAPIHGLGRALPATPAIMVLGLVAEAVGLYVTISARRYLGTNWSGEITIKEGHELIRSGPYARVRHPIYTGLLAMYVGATIATGEWLGAIGLGLALLAYVRKIRLEEANLATAFGPAYDAYRRESSALIPGIF